MATANNKNYVLLERITVGASGASSVTFNNIPQTGYTDLKVVGSHRSDASGSIYSTTYIRFNGDTNNANYSSKMLDGAGSGTPTSFANYLYWVGQGATSTTNTFASSEMYIPNYTSSNKKSVSFESVIENNATGAYIDLGAGLWQGTSAITSITIYNNGSNYLQYSTFSLYALSAVGTTPTIAPYASGGDIIQTDGTYWYHAFINSGFFTPNKGMSCDYLVVAGGGGGGASDGGGGGGAGGLRSTVTTTGGGGSLESALSLAANTSYTVTIGAGGAGGAVGYGNRGASGSNSVFASITSVGGGGGGAGSVGANYSSHNGGNGGSGVAISALATITGTGVSNYYAGGGGGGAGDGSGGTGGTGSAGGGNGGGFYGNSGTAATANTGSGGGAAAYGGGDSGGAGGSGIVIVRYAI